MLEAKKIVMPVSFSSYEVVGHGHIMSDGSVLVRHYDFLGGDLGCDDYSVSEEGHIVLNARVCFEVALRNSVILCDSGARGADPYIRYLQDLFVQCSMIGDGSARIVEEAHRLGRVTEELSTLASNETVTYCDESDDHRYVRAELARL